MFGPRRITVPPSIPRERDWFFVRRVGGQHVEVGANLVYGTLLLTVMTRHGRDPSFRGCVRLVTPSDFLNLQALNTCLLSTSKARTRGRLVEIELDRSVALRVWAVWLGAYERTQSATS